MWGQALGAVAHTGGAGARFNDGAQVALALIPTSTFTTHSVKPDQTAGVVAGAVRVRLSDTLDVYGDLRGRFSQNQSEGSLTVGGRYRF